MLRWHTSSCTEPHISIKGSGVFCHSCFATYVFNRKSLPRGTAANLNIPKDRPLGELRLRWPPSITYTPDKKLDDTCNAQETVRNARRARRVRRADKALMAAERFPESAAHSTIYRRLYAREFRLICLDSTKSQSDLIHLELEQYKLDDCPEYEATSYAWAGEDGDSNTSGPVFIGRFYDVAFHTKNCLSLLRYLRPSRGMRMVWIDAICIDQTNMHEKELQIAEMRNIFRNASRVVVYLGPETALHSNQKHRPRSELEYSQDVKELFDRRYFSRVWVIQELLLAKSLVIPLGDSDYHADRTSITRLNVDWNDTKAPWFRHIAGGRAFKRDGFVPLLNQTWASAASDPRDKLFGILGLVDTALCRRELGATEDTEQKVDYSLLPDYTLSTQETFIGLVAYVVMVLDERYILEHAAGLRAAPGYPTWLPDRQDPFIWRRAMAAKQEDIGRVQAWYKAMGLCCRKVWVITSGFKVQDISWRHNVRNCYEDLSPRTSYWALRKQMRLGNAAHGHISIQSSTAALSIELIRIIRLSSTPRRVLDLESLRVFEFVVAHYSLLICSDLIDLDLILDGTPTWMFLQEPDDGTGPTLLFLQQVHQEDENGIYKLVCSCHCWDLLLFRRPAKPDKNDIADQSPQEDNKAHYDSTQDILSNALRMEREDDCEHHLTSSETPPSWGLPMPSKKPPSWGIPMSYETLHAAKSLITIDLEKKIEAELPITLPYGRDIRIKDILPLLQLLADAGSLEALDYHQFGELYISIMSQFFSVPWSMYSPCYFDFPEPYIAALSAMPTERNIFFAIDPATWAECKKGRDQYRPFGITSARHISIDPEDLLYNQKKKPIGGTNYFPNQSTEQEMRNNGVCWQGWRRLGYLGVIYATVDENETMFMCMPVCKIVQYMNSTDLAKRLYNLTKFRGVTGQNETTMAQSTHRSARNVFGHPWPESLREEIGLIGEPCRVQIV